MLVFKDCLGRSDDGPRCVTRVMYRYLEKARYPLSLLCTYGLGSVMGKIPHTEDKTGC